MPVIYKTENGMLTFQETDYIASIADYETADRCEGSIFEVLAQSDFNIISLIEGEFELDDELDII